VNEHMKKNRNFIKNANKLEWHFNVHWKDQLLNQSIEKTNENFDWKISVSRPYFDAKEQAEYQLRVRFCFKC
jgi:hypothetical protein